MCAINLIPPLFAPGGNLDFWTEPVEICDHIELVSGIFYDNVYFLILCLTFTVIGVLLPYIIKSLPFFWKAISTFSGAWFFSGFIVEIINFTNPMEVINNPSEPALYFKYTMFLLMGSIFLLTLKKWNQIN